MKSAITACAVIWGCTAGVAYGQPVFPDVVHRWEAEGNAQDSAGSAHGIVSGTVGYSEGMFGEAFDFTDGQIDLGTTTANFGFSDFTISLWVRTSFTERQALISKMAGCGLHSLWDIRTYPQDSDSNPTPTPRIFTVVGGWSPNGDMDYQNVAAPESTIIDDGLWHHIAMRRAGTVMSLLVNGVEVERRDTEFAFSIGNDGTLLVGSHVCGDMNPFSGQLDEIQIYYRPLSDREIRVLSLVEANCAADIDHNGVVNVGDLLSVLGNWGKCE